jgi:hypothetical protein
MKTYDPGKGLIFIHIPKCGGMSVDRLLREWFGENFLRHGFKKTSVWYRVHPYEVKLGMCISGHFNKSTGRGVRNLYPQVDQLITFLRDPFEMALSQYFFWKRKRRAIKIKNGTLKEGSEHDYRDINDFFKKRPKSYMLDFMPGEVTRDNFKEVINENFVYIGIVEEIQTSVQVLSKKLGFPSVKIEHSNVSPRNETVSQDIKKEFVSNNRLEYLVYNYVLTTYTES